MFKHLIVPLDGSRLSEAVLPLAIQLAGKLNALVTLVHVIERNAPKAVHGERHLADPAKAEAYLEGLKKRMFPPELRVESHVHTTAITDVARSIVEHAWEFESDIVMMSTHGRSGLRDLFFGSIAQQIVSLGVPVLLVRPQEGREQPGLTGKPLLVPLDGTPLREQALEAAASLAGLCGVGLKLLMVVPTLQTLSGVENASKMMLPATTQEMLDLMHGDAVEYLQGLISRLAVGGRRATGEVLRGDPAELIVAAARRHETDLIVMSTAGKAGMNAFWSSSVAPKISSRTQLPLLLIPAHGGDLRKKGVGDEGFEPPTKCV